MYIRMKMFASGDATVSRGPWCDRLQDPFVQHGLRAVISRRPAPAPTRAARCGLTASHANSTETRQRAARHADGRDALIGIAGRGDTDSETACSDGIRGGSGSIEAMQRSTIDHATPDHGDFSFRYRRCPPPRFRRSVVGAELSTPPIVVDGTTTICSAPTSRRRSPRRSTICLRLREGLRTEATVVRRPEERWIFDGRRRSAFGRGRDTPRRRRRRARVVLDFGETDGLESRPASRGAAHRRRHARRDLSVYQSPNGIPASIVGLLRRITYPRARNASRCRRP